MTICVFWLIYVQLLDMYQKIESLGYRVPFTILQAKENLYESFGSILFLLIFRMVCPFHFRPSSEFVQHLLVI